MKVPSQTEPEMAHNAYLFHLQIIPKHKAGDGSLFLPGFINHSKITFVNIRIHVTFCITELELSSTLYTM